MAKRYISLLISFLSFVYLNAQTIQGAIKDLNNEPVPFARIRLLGSTLGTVSNAKGAFQFSVPFKKDVILEVSCFGFETKIDTLQLNNSITSYSTVLKPTITELEETIVTNKSKRNRGKEILEAAIDKRDFYYNQTKQLKCATFCRSSLEKELLDSVFKDSIIGRKKMNFAEWNSISYYKANANYKDEIQAFLDLTDRPQNNVSVSISIENDNNGIAPTQGTETDPYIFIHQYKDADVNLFKNLISLPQIAEQPIVSPLAFNSLVYYQPDLLRSYYNADNIKYYEIQIKPRFATDALFSGILTIEDETWALKSIALSLSSKALRFLNELHIVQDYENIQNHLVPVRKEFIYLIKEGRKNIHGAIRVNHTNHTFQFDDSKHNFWLETIHYADDAFDKPEIYWDSIRPFPLKPAERKFIREQDSIVKYHSSEEYLVEQDSIYNNLTIWSFLFNGIGGRNTFKKQEWSINPLIQQVVPFGVGGYRHRLGGSYSKGYANGKSWTISPLIDYGFTNKDVKGTVSGAFLYDPLHFSKLSFEIGDEYDFLNNYQSIQGSFAPANRVRNRKLTINHRREFFNGFYLKTGIFVSNRTAITGITYPEWVNAFGFFSKPTDFEGYRICMLEVEGEYHFRQKYTIKKGIKRIVGSEWPILALTYKIGIPKVFGGQSNFDYVELRLTDEIKLRTMGESTVRIIAGSFMRKTDLRIVEHKYFRTSDRFYFSNPIYSTQLLDTALSTSNNYIQMNGIHRFNGFFLNKIPLINRLKLQEVVGGSFLAIPDAKFAQAEAYVGLERPIRIRKTLFKIGVYGVSSASTFGTGNFTYKVGVSFYNPLTQKWDNGL